MARYDSSGEKGYCATAQGCNEKFLVWSQMNWALLGPWSIASLHDYGEQPRTDLDPRDYSEEQVLGDWLPDR